MKKSILPVLLIAALLCALLAGCRSETEPAITTAQPTQTTVPETTVPSTPPVTTVPPTTQTEPYIPAISPDTVGIYIPAANGTAARKHITEFKVEGLAPGKTSVNYRLLIKMKETVGNEFQGKTYTGIGVTVYAVQGNVSIKE